MRLALALSTAVFLAFPAIAQPQKRFDLICTIVARAGQLQVELRYSIDLENTTWCGPGCKAPEAIASIKPDTLMLKNMGPIGNDPRDRDDRHTITIKRADGAYESVFAMRAAGLVEVDKGRCGVADFTPFPETLF